MTEYKIVIVGARCTDKSELAVHFIQNHFIDEYDKTIEDTYRKKVMIDGETCLLDILDTSGQEEYSAMREQYMRSGQGFMLIYSITNKPSFDELECFREQILRVRDVDKVPMIIVGNHLERDSERAVAQDEGRALASRFGCPWMELSTKCALRIEDAFYEVVREIRKDSWKDRRARWMELSKRAKKELDERVEKARRFWERPWTKAAVELDAALP